jgi:hypothetical protein
MDRADLAARTGVPARKLRYVVDHRVLPGLRSTPAGHGVRRTFTDFEGFAIALAAKLLDAGLTRKLVAAVFDAACRPIGSTRMSADVPLYRAYAVQTGSLEIGDGRHLRLRAPKRPGIGDALDTSWHPLGSSGRIGEDYDPVVCLTVELGGLARAIRGHRGGADRT